MAYKEAYFIRSEQLAPLTHPVPSTGVMAVVEENNL